MSGSSQTRAGDRRPDMVAFLAILVAATVVQAAPPADIVSLAVPGRSNSTPSVAATGSFVAAAWGASSAGKSDVYLAVSNNSGQSFGEPVRVNTVAGEARLGGELPPRVALFSTGKSAAPEIAVVWTTRSETATELKLSRSRDGGRTFERAATLQSPGSAGDRGWPALAIDDQGGAHAIWLDHRGLAAARTSGAAHAGHRAGYSRWTARPWPSDRACSMPPRAPRRPASASSPRACAIAARPHSRPARVACSWPHGDMCIPAISVTLPSPSRATAVAHFLRRYECERRRMGNQRLPRRWPGHRRRRSRTVHLAWRTVIGGTDPEGALFYASTSDGRTFTSPSPNPHARRIQPHPPAACRRWPRANRGGVG